jgi:tetratricopeptide (TPR) repeat protein
MKQVLVAVLVLTTCAALHGCGGAEDRRARALERGQQFLEDHNYSKARVEFNNALQIQPNDADARYYVAFATEKDNDLRGAAAGYQAALNVDPTHPLALAALARLYVFSGLPEQGLEFVEKGLAAHPDHVELMVVGAAAKLALGREQEAFDDATAVLERQPNHEYAVALLAGLYRTRDEESRGIELIENALRASPDSVDLRVVLAQLLLDTDDKVRAEEELKRLIELQPSDLQHRRRLVAFYAAQGRSAEAEATLRGLIAQEPESVDNKISLVTYLANQRNLDTAEAELTALLAQSPNDAPLHLAAGQFYESHALPEDAERLYRAVIDRHGLEAPGLSARSRLAALRVRADRAEEALPLIDEVLEENPRDNDALVLRATLALAKGRTADAITDLRSVLRDQPDSAPLLRTLAYAHAQNNEPDLARDNYRRAIEVDPGNAQVRLEYADYLNRRGENEEARPLLDAVLNADPQNVSALEVEFRVLGALGDTAGAVKVAREISAARPEAPLGYYLEGLALESSRDIPAAISSYERALEKEPRGAEPLGALSRVLVTTNRRDEARARLEQVVATYPDHAVALNLLAEIALADGAVDRTIDLADRAIAVDTRWWLPYRTKALAYLSKGAADEAKKTYSEGLAASGNAAVLGMDLAALYEREKQPDRAIEVYERMHSANPAAEPLANNLAMLLATYRDDSASHERADELVRGFRTSDNPAYLNTYGWVRYRQGQYGEAVSYLRRAASATPDDPLMHYHLGMALLASGQPEEARAELERAISATKPFPGREAARRALDSLPPKPG